MRLVSVANRVIIFVPCCPLYSGSYGVIRRFLILLALSGVSTIVWVFVETGAVLRRRETGVFLRVSAYMGTAMRRNHAKKLSWISHSAREQTPSPTGLRPAFYSLTRRQSKTL